MDIEIAIMIIGPILFILIFTLAFIYIIKFNKRKTNVIETKEKHRFKYLDTFYYVHMFDTNADFTIYHIIVDISDSKIYSIHNSYFMQNLSLSKNNDELWMLKPGINKYSKIDFNDEGDFWIDKVLDYNQLDKYNTYHDEIRHLNDECDFNLINEAVFITGSAKFDE